METRNATYNEHGTIDCEIEHPKYGWIPFTASPDDVAQHGRDIYAALIESGNIPAYVEPVKTQAELDAELNQIKEYQKDLLINQKMESLLTTEFAEIDAATTKIAAKSVTLKG